MLNILITGANGQLGSELKALNSDYNYNFFFTNKNSLDITDKEALKGFVDTNNIDIIINTAAYTAVDKAEDDKINADKVNHLAVKYLATIAKEQNIQLIHISTDYVFDGKNYKPYNEDDKTDPNGVYGATKLAGEKAMQTINPKNSIIIRTSWVYSSFGENFVKTMLRLGKERDSLNVVFDQIGTPTYARDLAKVILDIIQHFSSNIYHSVTVYHYGNEGVCSWYDFAKEIMKIANLDCQVMPIETKDYSTSTIRPYYAVLNKSKIKNDFDIIIPNWRDSLEKMIGGLCEES